MRTTVGLTSSQVKFIYLLVVGYLGVTTSSQKAPRNISAFISRAGPNGADDMAEQGDTRSMRDWDKQVGETRDNGSKEALMVAPLSGTDTDTASNDICMIIS